MGLFLAAALVMIAPRRVSPPIAQQEVVLNGRFEQGGSTPTGWDSVYTAGGKLAASRDTHTFFHSPAALSLTGLDERAEGNVSGALDGVAGKSVQLDGVVRSEGAGIADAQVAVFTMDDHGKMLAWTPIVARYGFKDLEWTPFHAKVDVPREAAIARVCLLIKGKGTVWLGEISARLVDDAAYGSFDPTVRPQVAPTPRGVGSPSVTGISAIAPDVLEVVIRAGHVQRGSLSAYHPEPRDVQAPNGDTNILKRGGQAIGWLAGVNHDHLITYEHLQGDALQDAYANWIGTYRLTSTDDAGFGTPRAPLTVYRKSKPFDWEQPDHRFAMEHRIYLKLPQPLIPGDNYQLSFGDLNVATSAIKFKFEPERLVSEAVHVSQAGYDPRDPFKRAYLSCWRGSGGGQEYPKPPTFRVIDDVTHRTVLVGKAAIGKLTAEPEHMVREQNFVKADVYWLDFSALTRPGTYRVVADGIGCSLPFPVDKSAWATAFRTQMRGLLNERSGMDLRPPYTEFVRPADQMPNPGQTITESTYSALAGQEGFAGLVKGDTGKIVLNASGGYHDAGDWNPRRVTHLKVTMAHMELLDMFPEFYKSFKLNLPDSSALPDVLQEALWEIDFFRRLQKTDGGIPFGLETNGDPSPGDLSWLTTMHLYEFAPDAYSSWTYAAAAARASRLMARYDPKRAALYRDSAVRAMEWAQSHYVSEQALLSWEKMDVQNLAAIEMYWLTRDPKWHELYRKSSVLDAAQPDLFQWGKTVQTDSAFVYARLPRGLGDETLKSHAVAGFEKLAQQALAYASGNGFNITTPNKYRPFLVGFYTVADAFELCRAHYLTHKQQYLAGAVEACQFSTGANPENMAFTVGLGASSVQNPLLLDSRMTGQPAPKGLTVFGPVDFIQFNDTSTIWPMKSYLQNVCIPNVWTWPIPEAYFDIFLYPMINEFTVDTWAGNVYAWGYLAARS